MNIDLATIQLAATVVTLVAGIMFIIDSLLRRSDASGRLWALAFMCGIFAAFCYGAWVAVPGSIAAIVLGNAAASAGAGLLWSGARAFNGRAPLTWVPVAGGALVGATALVPSGLHDGWEGTPAMFAAEAVFAGLGAIETLRPPMREHWAARGLTAVFAVESAYHAVRAVAVAVVGPSSIVFKALFSTEIFSVMYIALVIVTVVCLVALRHDRLPGSSESRLAPDEMGRLHSARQPGVFRAVVADWLELAEFHDEQIVLLRYDLDEAAALNAAFGPAMGGALAADFVDVVRRHGSPHAELAVEGPATVLTAAPFATLSEARDSARAVQEALQEQGIDAAQGIRLSASIGIAGTDRFGYDLDVLVNAAGAAVEAAREGGGDAIALA